MGYAVVHLEKAKGTDSGMSAHMERTIAPKNADKERTHLNRELIDFPDGVENRTQAIQHRLDTAGLTRKIGKNQVRAIRVLLTGSHEDMARIVNEGRFDKWCNDNIDWLRETYGADNLVSAITALLELKEREQTELSKIRADKSKEQFKNSAADVGSKVMDSVSSMLGTPKVKRLEAENTQLKSDIADVRTEIEQVKEESQQRIDNYKRDVNREYNRRLDEFNRKESKLQQEIDRLKDTISKVVDLIPEILSHLRFTQLCKTIGFGIEMIRQLINGDEVRFNGDLYSELHNKRFHTDGSTAKRYQSNDRTEDAKLLIDNKPHDEWFREQHQKHTQTIEPQQRCGRRM
ncbi:MAG: MobV family relaxase [Rikenellaceae bacterium]